MQIKTSMRYHLTPARMAIIKKSTNEGGQDGGGVGRHARPLPQKQQFLDKMWRKENPPTLLVEI